MKLKSLLISIIAISAHAISANSQYFSLGPIAGGGFSNVNHDITETTSIGSYQLGLSMIYAKQEHWGIGTDLLYSKEGFRNNIQRPGFINYDVQHNFHYVRIPIKAIYFFGNYNDKLRPKIFAGPALGFGISSNHTFIANNDSTQTYLNTTDVSFEDEDIAFDLGIQAGVGANFNLGKGKWLNLDVSYYHGLINQSAAENILITNYNLKMNVGLLFPISANTSK